MNMPRKASLLSLIFLVAIATAQEPSQHVFRVETRLMEIEARVVGRDGKAVRGLTKQDFILKENGRQQQVATLDFVESPKQVESVAQESGKRPSSAPETAAHVSQPRTWIYIDTEVEATEITQTYKAVKQFLDKQLTPGLVVSLGGLPFTDDKTGLLATLGKMLKAPNGHPPEVPAMINPILHQEKAASLEWLLDSAILWHDQLPTIPGFGDLTLGPTMNNAAEDLKRDEQDMAQYGQIALFRYLDLIHKMDALPGKKVVVLFRSGMRIDKDNMQLLDQVAEAAARRRVSFYTVDSRGLMVVSPSEIKDELLSYGMNPDSVIAPAITGALNDYERIDLLRKQSSEGLVAVANATAGKTVTDNNDLHAIFDAMLKDSSEYYVLGYYPADKKEEGRFRSIKIAIDRPGVKVQTPHGYYEPSHSRRGKKDDNALSLWQALDSTGHGDFPITASADFFRGRDGRPVAVLSAGIRPNLLTPQKKAMVNELSATILTRITDPASSTLPIYRMQHLRLALNSLGWQEANADPSVFMTYNTQLSLAAGKHGWKVIFRDDNSGKLGTFEGAVDVPDYGKSPALSTLLLTRQVVPHPKDDPLLKSKRLSFHENGKLEAGGLDFFPQSEQTYRQGDVIHLLFDFYNPPFHGTEALVGYIHSKLLANNKPQGNFSIDWRFFADPDKKMICIIGALKTADLPAADYMIDLTLPSELPAAERNLSAKFTLLSK
jgi:VWFA-related protein